MDKISITLLSVAVLMTLSIFSGCNSKQSTTTSSEQIYFEHFSANPATDIPLIVGQKYILTPRISAEEYSLSIVPSNNKVIHHEGNVLIADAPGESEIVVQATDGTRMSTRKLKVTIKEKSSVDLGDIDLYLIGGQSNAVGHTTYNPEELDEASIKGFSNILYTGLTNNQSFKVLYKDWQIVKAGLGQSEKHIGPELGIAQKLSSIYNETTNKTAGIIKIGVGGSNLLDTDDLLDGKMSFLNQIMGNWVSPSMEKDKAPVSKNNFTGGLYRAFINGVTNAIEGIKMQGYSHININGMYWMQGESDREKPEEYKNGFKKFYSDIKKDLTEKTKIDLTSLPLLIGEISETFETATEESIQINKKFIEMQRSLIEEIPNASICNNSQFKINEWSEEQNKSIVVGSDNCHWSFKDALTIGNNVGTWMLSLNKGE